MSGARLVREFRESDLNTLREMHAAQGFAYEFPDLRDPLFVSKVVLAERGADGGERITGAALLRLTAEAYLVLDPRDASPRERWERIQTLHAATEQDAWRRGLSDVHAWLPPPITHKFGRRLERLGWVRDDAWTPYCRRVAPIVTETE